MTYHARPPKTVHAKPKRRIPPGMVMVQCRICEGWTPTYTPRDPVCRPCRKRLSGEIVDRIPPRPQEPEINPDDIPF